MDYLKLTFSDVSESEQEILIAQLADFGFIGFEQKETHLLAFANHNEIDLNELLPIIESYSFLEEQLPEVNWNEKWERDFEPIILTDKVAIRAHFHEPILDVAHEIIVTPKMSFGTGHHATTQLMLEQMSELDFKNKKVFDYGTGTGVLAIYAEMLGANNIIANDIDPWSEENANENVLRNNCQRIEIRLGGLEVVIEDEFDIILANINLNVLRESMKSLVGKLRNADSRLIISGILQQNEKDIIEIINLYTLDYHVFKKDKWLCIVVKI